MLHSSRRLIKVETVYADIVARFRTRSADVPINIWADDPGHPERVHIQCPDIDGEISE